MAAYMISTRNGMADAGQQAELADLAAQLNQPNAKLLLHLHGGLVNRQDGLATATRLSGQGPHSWQLGNDWTQVYVIWRTGFLETLRTNWTDLADHDRLYRSILVKLISFIARKLGLPMPEEEIRQHLTGLAEPRPFAGLDERLLAWQHTDAAAGIFSERSDERLATEFQEELANNPEFQHAASDITQALGMRNVPPAFQPGMDLPEGTATLARLDDGIRQELAALTPPGHAFTPFAVATRLLFHAGKIALRCLKRFRAGRDHGPHATVVEEICREFYLDRIGATIWGMIVQDAADHFNANGKFGHTLIDMLVPHPPEKIVITAHSAGSIWASHLVLNMKARSLPNGIARLFLLAPAIRADTFDAMILQARDAISHCHMVTMTDTAERRDAVLGPRSSYIYPCSLLYLVSGLFEKQAAGAAYPDAPILGMLRFSSLAGLTHPESLTAQRLNTFFADSDHSIIRSPTPGVSATQSHGAFDEDPDTLATLRGLF